MVLEQEVGAFELASLELAGGLYANNTDLACLGVAAMTATIATVRQSTVSTYGVATLTLDGQMAGTVQADMNCAGVSIIDTLSQVIGAAAVASSGQSITSLGLQAYGAAVAESIGLSMADYLAGAYATAQQSGQGVAAGEFGGQSAALAVAEVTAGSTVNGTCQAICLSDYTAAALAESALLAQAYGEQRLTLNGSSDMATQGARVHEATGNAAGEAAMTVDAGAYAATNAYAASIGLAHGAGQAVTTTRVAADGSASGVINGAYVLEATHSASSAAVSEFVFSAYGDMRVSVAAASEAVIVAPNARLFSWLAKSYDMAERAYETRGTIRPWETRGVKRPYEPRDNSVNAQPRMTNWS